MPEPDLLQEPRWPAVIALLAVGSLHLALPQSLSLGPRWLLLAVVGTLLIPTIGAHRLKRNNLNAFLGHLVVAIVTLDMVWSLALLVLALPKHTESSVDLLRSAVAIWLANILVFASWYWRLDAGGPNERERQLGHSDGAFLFPQMSLSPETRLAMGEDNWSPGFIDYLFIAYNTSTAFSPTDCPVLSRWAKVLMMIQSFIAFSTVILLAARAINIL
jgi:hypothetical protein